MVSIRRCDKCKEIEYVRRIQLYNGESLDYDRYTSDWEHIDLCPVHLEIYTRQIQQAIINGKITCAKDLEEFNKKFIVSNIMKELTN